MGMGQSDDVKYRQGQDMESVVDAAAAMVGFATSGAPVAIMLADDAPMIDPIARWRHPREPRGVGQRGRLRILPTGHGGSAALDRWRSDRQRIVVWRLDRNQGQVAATYSRAGEKPDVGLAAFQSAQRLDNAASIATAHAKGLPGVAATDITPTQYAELKRKRVNVVTSVGGLSYFGRRLHLAPRLLAWMRQWWLLWFKNRNAERRCGTPCVGSRRLTPGIMADVLTEVSTPRAFPTAVSNLAVS